MDLIEQLRRDEGVRYTPYKDEYGNETVGVGHKILPWENFSWAVRMSDTQVDTLLQADITNTLSALNRLSWFVALDPCRQAAVTNMAFNLGVHGLLGFPHMIVALSKGDWQTAHDQCEDPHWRAQVGERVDRIAEQLLTGEWV